MPGRAFFVSTDDMFARATVSTSTRVLTPSLRSRQDSFGVLNFPWHIPFLLAVDLAEAGMSPLSECLSTHRCQRGYVKLPKLRRIDATSRKPMADRRSCTLPTACDFSREPTPPNSNFNTTRTVSRTLFAASPCTNGCNREIRRTRMSPHRPRLARLVSLARMDCIAGVSRDHIPITKRAFWARMS